MKKSMIPNLLTFIRICLTPIMIILSLFKLYKIVIVLAIIGALTDMLDGKLARYWNVTSLKGAKLDDIADKVFAIGLLLCLIPKYKSGIALLLIFEIIIAITNYYYHKETNNTETLRVGKFKTTFLFVTIILYFLALYNDLEILVTALKYTTINLQIICLISYYIKYYKIKNNIKEDNYEEKLENDTIVIDSVEDLYKLTKKDD